MTAVSAAAVRDEILARPEVRSRIAELAVTAGRPVAEAVAEFAADLREMVATHGGPAGDVFLHIARLFDRTGYRGRVRVDAAQLARLQDLNRRYPMALLPSHRSYIDPVVLASVLQRATIPPTYKLGGSNVAFWPMGPLGRRAGLIFIRRSFRDDPVYKLALREYVGWLAEHRQNLEWYIEGGRTRTGKLRDPRLGLLAYLVDAVNDDRCDDFLLQPVSIVYDELLDVEEHARSVTGAAKTPESLGRLITYARAQRTRYSRGDIHVSFGDPISVREHLTRELEAAVDSGETETLPLQKLAFEVAVRINTVTPITPPALITMALLWADRALTVDQLLALLERYADDVDARGLPVTARPVDARETVLSGLSSLQRHGVVTRYDGGREPVYLIQPDQRIAASYYRNGILHFYLIPAITDLALARSGLASARSGLALARSDLAMAAGDDVLDEALRLRDLLKFEFFFAEKPEFLAEVEAERTRPERPVTAPFLRPFLEAYWVVAEALRERGNEPVADADALLADACGLGEQYLLQHRIYCADAVSSSYADGAIRLAGHRDLLAPAGDTGDLAQRRTELADELHALVRLVRTTQTWAAQRFLEIMRGH
ncbi:MAG: glycerol-3-phosphate O-acyltransferase [Actinomycetota bacterium]|nr:glycerol-3-phosphate O-acyltransferase [Actinomycetota bacterium]